MLFVDRGKNPVSDTVHCVDLILEPVQLVALGLNFDRSYCVAPHGQNIYSVATQAAGIDFVDDPAARNNLPETFNDRLPNVGLCL